MQIKLVHCFLIFASITIALTKTALTATTATAIIIENCQ